MCATSVVRTSNANPRIVRNRRLPWAISLRDKEKAHLTEVFPQILTRPNAR